jgi:hypothetical protein
VGAVPEHVLEAWRAGKAAVRDFAAAAGEVARRLGALGPAAAAAGPGRAWRQLMQRWADAPVPPEVLEELRREREAAAAAAAAAAGAATTEAEHAPGPQPQPQPPPPSRKTGKEKTKGTETASGLADETSVAGDASRARGEMAPREGSRRRSRRRRRKSGSEDADGGTPGGGTGHFMAGEAAEQGKLLHLPWRVRAVGAVSPSLNWRAAVERHLATTPSGYRRSLLGLALPQPHRSR